MTPTLVLGLKCLKYSLLVLNLMLLVIGVCMIYMGSVLVSIYNAFKIFMESDYFSTSLFMMSIGAIILVVSLYGCVGAILHSAMIIDIYIFFTSILTILEVAAVITTFIKRHDIQTFINTSMHTSMNFYKNDTEFTESWNSIQEKFLCCGVHNIKDWSLYNITEITVLLQSITFGVPKSCCAIPDCTVAFSQGCWDYISSIIWKSGFVLAISASCVAIIQFLGASFGYILTKTIRRVKSIEEINRQKQNKLYDKINKGKSTLY